MREIITEIDIRARASQVWEILMEFDAYPAWNPFIKKIAGKPADGSRLDVTLEPPGGGPMRFRPRVRAASPEREFRWKGSLYVPGIFDGEHQFIIEPASKNRVNFTQREQFSGILVPFLWKMLDTKTRKGFVAMNKALKLRAEKAGGVG
ncbi:MAG: SRPBCC domain-containing protein [Deltaproteobacteria bacterium]|nr:SRPBCC domain-containing protein [Candidatus Zymogenaceae bacterium]